MGAGQGAVAVVAAAAAAAAACIARLRALRVLLLLLLVLRLTPPLLLLVFASSRASNLHRTLHHELRRLHLQLHLRVVSCAVRGRSVAVVVAVAAVAAAAVAAVAVVPADTALWLQLAALREIHA